MYFSDLASTLQNISKDKKAVFVSGQPGSGKTFAALQFCAEHKESLYFSFKNLMLSLRFRCSVMLIPKYSAAVKAGTTFSIA